MTCSDNRLLNIMLRRVGLRTWECRVTCTLHNAYGLAADIDNREKVLQKALKELSCGCWSNDD